MSSISDIQTQLSGGASNALTGGQSMGQDTFLKLLTTQLQHQDPSNPTSSEEFVAQLATFSSLEQLMGIQSSLDAVYMGIASMNNASMANLLGAEVVAAGDTFHYSGEGGTDLQYHASTAASSAKVTIRDEDGDVVASMELGALSDGDGTIPWDGQDLSGNPLPEGDYTFTITASDAEGNDVSVQERISGTITEMDYSSGSPQPSVDGVTVALADILRLTAGEEG